ncbi:hypothetical protein CW304_28895 [Bacillus sp. UFRGS-B20]|nr:hypothetical protein CW304_28895 [Bacillus sp. UFRGS-B20]
MTKEKLADVLWKTLVKEQPQTIRIEKEEVYHIENCQIMNTKPESACATTFMSLRQGLLSII